jgi:hypothetical protein
MPKKKYSELKKDEVCIYQAFTKASKDTAQQMGDFVNAKNLDADDDKAVLVLAEKYGFTQCDMVLASDLHSGEANFHANSEVIAIITNDNSVRAKVPGVSASMNIKADPREVLANSGSGVVWHAVYGVVDAKMNVQWHDDQKIFPKGPTGTSCAVYFSKAR